MKNLKVVFPVGLLVILSSYANNIEYQSIDEAVSQKEVSYSIIGNSKSTHYVRPVVMTIKNLRNYAVKIKIDNGLQLISDESPYQDLIITKSEFITLKPQENKEIAIHAMCTQSSDRSPNQAFHYTLGKMAPKNLRGLTNLIENKGYHNSVAQYAVWSMTSEDPLEDIVGFDTVMANELIKYVANATGKPIPKPPAEDDYLRNYHSRNIVSTMGGKFEYKFSKPKSITIAMFDTNSIVVRELFNNLNVSPGYHSFNFEFDATVYTDDYYYIRLIADGNILLSSKIEMF